MYVQSTIKIIAIITKYIFVFDSILSNKEKYLCDAKKIFLENHHQHTDAEQKKEEITKKLAELNKPKQKNIYGHSQETTMANLIGTLIHVEALKHQHTAGNERAFEK